MIERVYFAPVANKFRISKPGKSITSSNLDDFLIHEGFVNAVPDTLLTVTTVAYVADDDGVQRYLFQYEHGYPFIPLVAYMANLFNLPAKINGNSYETTFVVWTQLPPTGDYTFISVDETFVKVNLAFETVINADLGAPAIVTLPIAIFNIPVQ